MGRSQQPFVKAGSDEGGLYSTGTITSPRLLIYPNRSIAHKLLPWQYEKGYLKLTHKEFTGRFNADAMLLLKRSFGTKDKWQIAKRFDFENMPVILQRAHCFEINACMIY